MVMPIEDMGGTAIGGDARSGGAAPRRDFRPVGAGSTNNISGGADLGGVASGGDIVAKLAEAASDVSSPSDMSPSPAPQSGTNRQAPPPTQTPTSPRAPTPTKRVPPTPTPPAAAVANENSVVGASEVDPASRLGLGRADEGPRTFARPGSRSFNPFLGRAFGVDLANPAARRQAATQFGQTAGDIGRRNALGAGAGANVGSGGFAGGIGDQGLGSPDDPLNSVLAQQLLG